MVDLLHSVGYKTALRVDFNSPDDPACLFEIVSTQRCVIVNQYNTTLSEMEQTVQGTSLGKLIGYRACVAELNSSVIESTDDGGRPGGDSDVDVYSCCGSPSVNDL